MCIRDRRDSLKSQLDLALKEIEDLKGKNDCDDILKNNEFLSSKLDFTFKENLSLKSKIDFVTKELDLVLKKNESLQNDLDSHVCHASVASSSCNSPRGGVNR